MKTLKNSWPLWVALLLAAALKTWLTLIEAVPFNSDEAVVATMARHILQGARPVFFYGQAYMGSLDAWLLAAAFKLLGEHVWVIRLVQSGLYLLFIISLWWLANLWFSKDRLVQIFVVLLAAIPPVLVTTYSTATLGGYGESLVLGNLILGLGFLVVYGGREADWYLWLALGVVGGLAFWTLGIAGVYLLPVGLVGLLHFKWQRVPYYLLAAGGWFLGALPWWLYNFSHQWAGIEALFGSYVIESVLLDRVISLVLFGFPTLLGMRAPWSDGYFPLPLTGLILFFHLAIGLYIYHNLRHKRTTGDPGGRTLIFILVAVFIAVFVFSRYGLDVSGRYMLPLYVPFVFAAAELLAAATRQRAALGVALLLAIWLLNGATTWISAQSEDRITTQFDPITSFDNSYDAELIAFLEEHGELRGYSNYWVTYRFAFLTKERILFSPELPNKLDMSYTAVDVRYPAYAAAADASPQVAYITSKHPDLDAVLRTRFDALGVDYQEQQIGPFHIFFALSRAVRPEEVGFGDGVQH